MKLNEDDIQLLLKYFLEKKGCWEEYNNNIDEGFRNRSGFRSSLADNYIGACFSWRNSKEGGDYWASIYSDWDRFVDSRKFIKNTKIARLIHKDKIIQENGDCLLIMGEL